VTGTAPTTVTRGGFLLVTAAAALWGTSALFRFGPAEALPASTVVAVEHLILVAVLAPVLVRGVRRARATFDRGDVIALMLVGVGASAVATVLFTTAFAFGDPNTPLLLQQLQPVFAVLGARLVLGERLLRRYPVFFVLAVTGAFLVTFEDPTQVSVAGAAPAVLAASAAALWGMGTVLGRRLTAKVSFFELAALRFGVGLPAALLLLPVGGGAAAATSLDGEALTSLLLLALIPGLLGLTVYYRGLRGTPASSATLAELAFPLSSLLVNYLAFGATLTLTQGLGVLLLAATITVMGLAHQRRPEAAGVRVPAAQAAGADS